MYVLRVGGSAPIGLLPIEAECDSLSSDDASAGVSLTEGGASRPQRGCPAPSNLVKLVPRQAYGANRGGRAGCAFLKRRVAYAPRAVGLSSLLLRWIWVSDVGGSSAVSFPLSVYWGYALRICEGGRSPPTSVTG